MSAISPSRKGSLAFWQSLGRRSFGYWLIFPALLVILGLNLYPTIQGILTSFTNQSLIDPGHSLYIGLDNYFKLLKEPVFQVALAHSLELTFFAVVLQVILGLVMAHLLIQKVPGIHFFRSVAMITWVLPIIASVVMFRFMTLPSYGLINILLKDAGLGQSGSKLVWRREIRFPFGAYHAPVAQRAILLDCFHGGDAGDSRRICTKPHASTEQAIGGNSGS